MRVSLPENLVAKPTLVWLLRNQTSAAQKVEASYLTGQVLLVDGGVSLSLT